MRNLLIREQMSEYSEELLSKQKKEVKDLQATVTGMKKQANKKTRKQVVKRCQELEDSLKLKHEDEKKKYLMEANGVVDDEENDEVSPEQLLAQLTLEKASENQADLDTPETEVKAQPKKRNRQKERLARREEEKNKIRSDAAKEAEGQTDYRAIELKSLGQLCDKLGLAQHDIKPDGNCLFASIADQLELRHGTNATVSELRKRVAKHIGQHESQFQPFLFNEQTLEMGSVGEYVARIQQNGEWGGDIEILALANEFNCPVSVLISGSAAHRVNEQGEEPELKLVYYKHAYGLGEHYNSLRDVDGEKLDV